WRGAAGDEEIHTLPVRLNGLLRCACDDEAGETESGSRLRPDFGGLVSSSFCSFESFSICRRWQIVRLTKRSNRLFARMKARMARASRACRPCLYAFCEARTFPAAVLGPVECFHDCRVF